MEDDLRIYAEGTAFRDGLFDLRALETLIGSYRLILDRLVAVQLGRRQLTEKTKEQLNYDVKVKEGSIDLLINFILEHPEVVGVLASDGGYQLSNALTRLYRDAISLRRAASKFIEKGASFNIKINNSFNFGSDNVYINVEDSEILISDPKILWSAQVTRSSTDKLLRHIDGKKIEHVDLISKEEEFSLDEKDKILLGRDKELLPAKLQIVGRLDVIAFTSHRGVIISELDRFPVTWDEEIRSKLQQIADKEGVVFTVNPIVDHSRLNSDAIAFHVLDCNKPQSDFDF